MKGWKSFPILFPTWVHGYSPLGTFNCVVCVQDELNKSVQCVLQLGERCNGKSYWEGHFTPRYLAQFHSYLDSNFLASLCIYCAPSLRTTCTCMRYSSSTSPSRNVLYKRCLQSSLSCCLVLKCMTLTHQTSPSSAGHEGWILFQQVDTQLLVTHVRHILLWKSN